MKKPGHQWETRLHRAVRLAEVPGDWVGGGRDEAFALQFFDGRSGRAVLGLHRQRVDAVGASDPDLPHAVRCWLAARGGRATQLCTEGGVVLEAEAFTPADLGDAPPATPQRLVTLAPSNAEVVDALGCFDRVIACEDSSD